MAGDRASQSSFKESVSGPVAAHHWVPVRNKASAGWWFEFEARLVYRLSFRIASATHRNPVSKNQEEKQNKTEERAH